jgi:hypothetical protein
VENSLNFKSSEKNFKIGDLASHHSKTIYANHLAHFSCANLVNLSISHLENTLGTNIHFTTHQLSTTDLKTFKSDNEAILLTSTIFIPSYLSSGLSDHQVFIT